MRILVTGFGPFPRMPRNPSAALARAVGASRRWRLLGHGAEVRVLTTAYSALSCELDPALATSPEAVLMIGVAGRSGRVRVERRATGRRSTLFPDVAGAIPSRPLEGRAVGPRRTKVNPTRTLLALRRAGVPARISRDAGRYLCNAAYFHALARPGPALFVHIPVPRPGWRRGSPVRRRASMQARLRDALIEIGLAMLTDARRLRPALPQGGC